MTRCLRYLTYKHGEGALSLEQAHHSSAVKSWLEGVRRNGSRPWAMRRNVLDKNFKNARPFGRGMALGELYR